ncbi:MAG: hypothetical protein F6J97_16460, partial [Leptolyngbya sp. SIO4C1]|nr:hypothetical protein [Leptolyngbya sp. SIO4C1]
MQLKSFLGLMLIGLTLAGCGGGGGGSDSSQPSSTSVLSTASENNSLIQPALTASASQSCAQHPRFFNELLGLTNSARQSQGLSPLRFSYRLGQSAQTYAQEMAVNNFFSHTGKNGS